MVTECVIWQNLCTDLNSLVQLGTENVKGHPCRESFREDTKGSRETKLGGWKTYLSSTRCIIQNVKNINKKTENINVKQKDIYKQLYNVETVFSA